LGVAVTVKKKVYGLFLALALLTSLAVGFLISEAARANPVGTILPFEHAPNITINSDGSVTPEMGLISRNGNTYTLTANITNYQIFIQRSNIVFDGVGHSINVTAYDVYDEDGIAKYTANFQAYGIFLGGSEFMMTNVTIRNVEIISTWVAIGSFNCLNCLITGVTSRDDISIDGDNNVITNCSAQISILSGSGNTIFKNNVSVLWIGGGGNLLYLNNIFDISPPFFSSNFLDNGSVGNYWSNYTAKYPHMSEIGFTGLGNTPYEIDKGNIDHYPLMYPYDIEKDEIALPIREPLPEPEPFPTTLVAVASAVSVAIISVGLLVYFRKRKR
jgi:hypothetical protein